MKLKLIEKLLKEEIEKAKIKEKSERQGLNKESEFAVEKVLKQNCKNVKENISIESKLEFSAEEKDGFKKCERDLKTNHKRENNIKNSKPESFCKAGKKFKTSIRSKRRRLFLPEEDEIIHKELKRCDGEKFDYKGIAKQLNRSYRSIKSRCDKIRSGDIKRRNRAWLLIEDQLILDELIEKFKTSELPLSKLNLSNTEWKNLDIQMKRTTVRGRWDFSLKPWILQYFNGTLNFDVDPILVNFISDNYNEFDSIDWNFVIQRREFAGHTIESLAHRYMAIRSAAVKASQRLFNEDSRSFCSTPQEMVEACKLFQKRKIYSKVLSRQQNVIQHFLANVDQKVLKERL